MLVRLQARMRSLVADLLCALVLSKRGRPVLLLLQVAALQPGGIGIHLERAARVAARVRQLRQVAGPARRLTAAGNGSRS